MGEAQQAQEPRAERLKAALASRDIPHIYANGFMNALSDADIVVMLERDNSPVAILNMSYTTAKSLAEKLSHLISAFEKNSGQTIMTSDDVNKALSQRTEGQP